MWSSRLSRDDPKRKNDFTFWIHYGISTNFGMIVLDYPKSEVTHWENRDLSKTTFNISCSKELTLLWWTFSELWVTPQNRAKLVMLWSLSSGQLGLTTEFDQHSCYGDNIKYVTQFELFKNLLRIIETGFDCSFNTKCWFERPCKQFFRIIIAIAYLP